MNKRALTNDDYQLVEAAKAAINQPHHFEKRRVAAGLRTIDGDIATGIVLEADIPALTVCAEPIAIGKLLDKPSQKIDLIVAVIMETAGDSESIQIYPPCGRCREFISDYGPDADVIVREPNDKNLFKVSIRELLPLKCADYRADGRWI